MASSAGRAGRGGEVMYDQRLFNQDKGMDSGFTIDDQYRVYDKVLFIAQPTLSTLYSRPNKGFDVETYGNAEQLQMTDPIKMLRNTFNI
nr:snw/ski-interacting protein [Quercus suber]